MSLTWTARALLLLLLLLLFPVPSPFSPRKSLVRLSVLRHVETSPDVNPPRYSVEIMWLAVPNSPTVKPADWPCWAAAAPTAAAFWRSAVAERWADDVAGLELGCVLTWRLCKGEVISPLWGCCGCGGRGGKWRWDSGLMRWWSGEFWVGLVLGFWWDCSRSHGVREMVVKGGNGVFGFVKCCCWWVGKGKREIWGVIAAVVVVAVANWFAESLALSSAKASQNALWVMKLSFLKNVGSQARGSKFWSIWELKYPMQRRIQPNATSNSRHVTFSCIIQLVNF